MKTVLSGIQPTGNLHLGNYLGAIKNWIDLQDNYKCLFGIMNLHAITVPQDPKELQANVIDVAAVYIASGLDPKKSTFFVQSEVSAHTELAWVLGTITPMGWLKRMTQFKDKTQQKTIISEKDYSFDDYFDDLKKFNIANLGLFSYPVLMAADILAYKADLVPVGEDQKQHLELTRDLAGAFNRQYKVDYFKLPEPLIVKQVKRIMSLQDGTKKMSKSDESDLTRINLNDEPDLIVKKIKKAKTDSLSEIAYDENRPELYNLLNIFATFTLKDPHAIADEYKTAGYGKFKGDLAEILVEKLQPIQYNLGRLKADKQFILDILKDGKEKASQIADKTRREVFDIVGLK